ncbi:MAG TPA: Scr1 family TA system antitoxin-like transcriptional regulator [Micromonospora sp.]|nr:Scr1 family TA system antitoxin-like transcriptional regulator [Micromonospora sp.]
MAARIERQAVLARDEPPQFVAVLDEYVLRRAIGGPAVMREQLRHLVGLGRKTPGAPAHRAGLGRRLRRPQRRLRHRYSAER